jgi:hypothetical protein
VADPQGKAVDEKRMIEKKIKLAEIRNLFTNSLLFMVFFHLILLASPPFYFGKHD